MLVYEADLPEMPSNIGDIAKQTLTVGYTATDGTEVSESQDLSVTDTVATFRVPQDVSVTLSLVYVDDAGNVSAPSTQSFHSLDTIPPDAPGAFGEIRLVDEE